MRIQGYCSLKVYHAGVSEKTSIDLLLVYLKIVDNCREQQIMCDNGYSDRQNLDISLTCF